MTTLDRLMLVFVLFYFAGVVTVIFATISILCWMLKPEEER